jgi:hypothetical protein
VDVGITMKPDRLTVMLQADGIRHRATWNIRIEVQDLSPGWKNRLFVASGGFWKGYFPLLGDVPRDSQDPALPYRLTFDPSGWVPIVPVRAPRFRGLKRVTPVRDGNPST